MEKNAFLRELALILRQRGLTDDEIRVRIEKISSFIDGLSAEERNAVIGGNPNVAAIADRLFAKEGAGKSAAQPKESKPEAKAEPSRTKKPEPKMPEQDSFKITSDYKKTAEQPIPEGITTTAKNMAEIRRRDEEKLKALKDEAQRPRKKQTPHATIAQRFESERNFWVIFFCCIPVLFVLLGAIVSFFCILFFGLIALILLLVA
ncbi:MAG: hypothetical protein IJE84_02440, partial [Clostridia bacterium]|nr:hypothetical protein [Clostridia bacterium]